MSNLLQIDRTCFTWINTGCSNPIFDVTMPSITHLGDAATVWLWIVFIGLLMVWQLAHSTETDQQCKRQPGAIIKAVVLFSLYMALIHGITTGACTGLKRLCNRSRPFLQQTVMLRISPATASVLANEGSFPSGHSTNAFMIAALLAERVRKKRYYPYCMAGLVAFSRVYLGVHYPADVIVGSCLGLSITWVMLFFHRKVLQKYCVQ